MGKQTATIWVTLALLVVSGFVGQSYAVDVGALLETGADKVVAAQKSQLRVDEIADDTHQLLSDFKTVNRQIEGLQVYNAQLESQIQNQQQNMEDLRSAIKNAAVMERQIPPLMSKMTDSLEQFVALDIPFLLPERRQRVSKLKDNLTRSDITTAEKFRQLLEAYNIESEYGSTIETYQATLPVDNVEREMNVLRVGRIALVAQSNTKDVTLGWDKTQQQWVALGSEYRGAVARGIQVARKQASIEILSLPIMAPEAVR